MDFVPSDPNGAGGVAVQLTGESMTAFMDLNEKSSKVYEKYGIEEPPGKNSTMNSRKKIDFFIDFLQLNDSGSNENKQIPNELKYLLNRRFNNTLRHASETLEAKELKKLYEKMSINRVGDFNR